MGDFQLPFFIPLESLYLLVSCASQFWTSLCPCSHIQLKSESNTLSREPDTRVQYGLTPETRASASTYECYPSLHRHNQHVRTAPDAALVVWSPVRTSDTPPAAFHAFRVIRTGDEYKRL